MTEQELQDDRDELPDLLGLNSQDELARKVRRISVSLLSDNSIKLIRLRQRDDKPVVYGSESRIIDRQTAGSAELGEVLLAMLE